MCIGLHSIASVYVCNYMYYTHTSHIHMWGIWLYIYIYKHTHTYVYVCTVFINTCHFVGWLTLFDHLEKDETRLHISLLGECTSDFLQLATRPSSGPELRCRVILPTVFQCQWWLLEPSDKLHVIVIPKKNRTDINMNINLSTGTYLTCLSFLGELYFPICLLVVLACQVLTNNQLQEDQIQRFSSFSLADPHSLEEPLF